MTIIDGKGRLFGIINILDFIVLVCILIFIFMFSFGYKLFKQNTKTQPKVVETELTCMVKGITPETLQNLQKDPALLDPLNKTLGTIVSVGDTWPYQTSIDLGKGEEQILADPILINAQLTIRIKAELRDKSLFIHDFPILADIPMPLRTSSCAFSAIPIGNESRIAITVKFLGIMKEISRMVKYGDAEKERSGRTIATIKTISSNEPSQVAAIKVEENKIVLVNAPHFHDILATLEVIATNKNGNLFFKNKPVKVGESFVFSSFYTISGIITDITFL